MCVSERASEKKIEREGEGQRAIKTKRQTITKRKKKNERNKRERKACT